MQQGRAAPDAVVTLLYVDIRERHVPHGQAGMPLRQSNHGGRRVKCLNLIAHLVKCLSVAPGTAARVQNPRFGRKMPGKGFVQRGHIDVNGAVEKGLRVVLVVVDGHQKVASPSA